LAIEDVLCLPKRSLLLSISHRKLIWSPPASISARSPPLFFILTCFFRSTRNKDKLRA
jgi:hypothetical protein